MHAIICADVMRLVPVLAVSTVLTGVLGPAAPARTATHSMVIRLISKNSVVSFVDTEPKGKPNAGDRITTTSTLRNQVAQFGKRAGALVGHDRASVKLLSATAYETHGYAVLPGGRIRFGGRASSARSAGSIAVTGGTGRFAQVRGTVYAKDLKDSLAVNVYRLTLP